MSKKGDMVLTVYDSTRYNNEKKGRVRVQGKTCKETLSKSFKKVFEFTSTINKS